MQHLTIENTQTMTQLTLETLDKGVKYVKS